MVTQYLLLAAIVLKAVYTLDATCFDRLCHGPKFKQSDCCVGFICVALYKPGAEDVLECVDEEEHFRVKNISEIILEVDREFGEFQEFDEFEEGVISKKVEELNLLLDDNSLTSYIAKMREIEDNMFDTLGFNNPIIFDNQLKNITM